MSKLFLSLSLGVDPRDKRAMTAAASEAGVKLDKWCASALSDEVKALIVRDLNQAADMAATSTPQWMAEFSGDVVRCLKQARIVKPAELLEVYAGGGSLERVITGIDPDDYQELYAWCKCHG